MPPSGLELYRKSTGRKCPRVAPLTANRPVIRCAHELINFPESASEIWADYTEGMDRQTRRKFRRRVGIYRGELRKLMRANADAKAAARAKAEQNAKTIKFRKRPTRARSRVRR